MHMFLIYLQLSESALHLELLLMCRNASEASEISASLSLLAG